METFFGDIVKNGGPSAIVLGIGLLWVKSDLRTMNNILRERCNLIHQEVNRRVSRLEEAWDGIDRRKQIENGGKG